MVNILYYTIRFQQDSVQHNLFNRYNVGRKQRVDQLNEQENCTGRINLHRPISVSLFAYKYGACFKPLDN